MALSVGYGNSILFRPNNGQLPSFDNTFLCDELFINHSIKSVYNTKMYDTDTLVIQIKVTSGDVPTMAYYKDDGTTGAVALVLKTSYTLWDFYECSLSLSTYTGDVAYFVVSNAGDDDWESEPIKVLDADTIDSNDGYHLVEWYNLDPTTTGGTTENFEVDYTTGITPFMRIPLVFKAYEPKVEVSTYENLDEVVKLREKVKRTLMMKTDNVPRYIAEKLTIATAHDKFYVNEVEFIREEKPEINDQEGGNFTDFQAVLTQANVLGLNSSDIGFDCDNITVSKIVNSIQTGVTVNTTFTIPEGYLLQSITAVHNGLVATNTLLKFGRTVGGDEIATMNVSPNAIGTYKNTPKTTTKNIVYSESGSGTLYVDVSGTSPDADITVTMIDITS